MVPDWDPAIRRAQDKAKEAPKAPSLREQYLKQESSRLHRRWGASKTLAKLSEIFSFELDDNHAVAEREHSVKTARELLGRLAGIVDELERPLDNPMPPLEFAPVILGARVAAAGRKLPKWGDLGTGGPSRLLVAEKRGVDCTDFSNQ